MIGHFWSNVRHFDTATFSIFLGDVNIRFSPTTSCYWMTAIVRCISISEHPYFRVVKVFFFLKGVWESDEKGVLVCSLTAVQSHILVHKIFACMLCCLNGFQHNISTSQDSMFLFCSVLFFCYVYFMVTFRCDIIQFNT